MVYRLFLYKSSARNSEALAVSDVNYALSEIDWESEDSENYIRPFDAGKIKRLIEKETNCSGKSLCNVYVGYSPKKKIEYITVATSYKNAKNVLIATHNIAAKFDLVLYDIESEKTFFGRELFYDGFINMKSRAQEINNKILKTQEKVYRIRKLSLIHNSEMTSCSYVVTLTKVKDKPLEKRISSFYNCLVLNLANGEDLYIENNSFVIRSETYEIVYCLEAYKKHADKIGTMKHGKPQALFIKRMDCEQAFKWLKRNEVYLNDVESAMKYNEMIRIYPNPADRFVASVNIKKQELKEKFFSFRYSDIGYYGSEILFHVVPDSYFHEKEQISVLKIGEESATYILPMIYEVYPYFDKRYYLTENHLPAEMMADVVKKIKKVKEMILNDTYNKKLKPYFEAFNLYVVSNSKEEDELICSNPAKLVYNRRYEIAHFYDIFIDWFNLQLRTYSSDDLMFNIQGP